MQEATNSRASTLIWTKNREVVLKTQITIFEPEAKVILVKRVIEYEPKVFEQHLAVIGTNDCFFSISAMRANIFFKTPYLGFSNHGIRFRAPENLFKVQRRKDLRLKIPSTLEMRLFPMKRRIIDLSASGLSIAIAENEKTLFVRGSKLTDLQFALGGETLNCNLEVMYVRPLDKPGLVIPHLGNEVAQVGLRFVDTPQTVTQAVAKYVFNETRRMFARLL